MTDLSLVSYKVEDEEITLKGDDVRNHLVRGNGEITDSEIIIFMRLCKSNQIDPFTNDAYLIKWGTQPASMMMGKDAFVKRADNFPQYDGMDFGVSVINNNKLVYRKGALVLQGEQLVGGWCEVYRKDREHPTHAEVTFSEYNTGKSNWAKMPATMICKVAKSQALREAFPNQFSGFYDESEISEPKPDDVMEAEVLAVEEPAPEAPTSTMRAILKDKMQEGASMGIKVSGMREAIESKLETNLVDLTEDQCEVAVAIVSSLIADKQSLLAAETSAEAEAAPELYEEDVPF